MQPVDIADDAGAELRATIAWYEEREPGVGQRFAVDVEACVAALPKMKLKPLKGYAARGVTFVEVGGPWPYRIIVVEQPTLLWIVAFAHHRRAPGYWLPRVRR